MVERQLPKLNVAGSIPVSRSNKSRATPVATQKDREHGQSLRPIAKGHSISTATVQQVLRMPPAQKQMLDALLGMNAELRLRGPKTES